MIFPSKHLRLEQSLLGTGRLVLLELEEPQTYGQLLLTVRSLNEQSALGKRTWDVRHFHLTLCWLYAIKAIELNKDGEIELCA